MGTKEGLMAFLRTAIVAAAIALAMNLAAFAEDPGASATPPETATPAPDAGKSDMTAEERAEKQARKACKVKICNILATKDPQGDDVACDIVKTWREATSPRCLAAGSPGPGARRSANRSSRSSAMRW
jgi:hypothetical protein